MATLPEPTTRSPGSLCLHYKTGALEHVTSAKFIDGVDFDTSIAAIRTEAGNFATALAPVCGPSVSFNAWTIRDPDGVELYRESFSPPIVGTFDVTAGAVTAQSASLSWVGKGVGPTVGLKSGNCRVMVFPGWFTATDFQEAKVIAVVGNAFYPPLAYLNASLLVGADFYGDHAEWSTLVNTQINAHYQKRYGL